MKVILAALFVSAAAMGPSVAEEYRVSGNETYVIVAPISDESKALSIAEQHCCKYRKIPHFQRMDGFRAVFGCASKSK